MENSLLIVEWDASCDNESSQGWTVWTRNSPRRAPESCARRLPVSHHGSEPVEWAETLQMPSIPIWSRLEQWPCAKLSTGSCREKATSLWMSRDSALCRVILEGTCVWGSGAWKVADFCGMPVSKHVFCAVMLLVKKTVWSGGIRLHDPAWEDQEVWYQRGSRRGKNKRDSRRNENIYMTKKPAGAWTRPDHRRMCTPP